LDFGRCKLRIILLLLFEKADLIYQLYRGDLRKIVQLVLIRFSALDKRKDRVLWCLPLTRYLYIDMTISGLDATRQTKIGDKSCGDAGISADGHLESIATRHSIVFTV
jgi:hypothetical protein